MIKEQEQEVRRLLSHLTTSIIELEAYRERSNTAKIPIFIYLQTIEEVEEQLIVIHSAIKEHVDK